MSARCGLDAPRRAKVLTIIFLDFPDVKQIEGTSDQSEHITQEQAGDPRSPQCTGFHIIMRVYAGRISLENRISADSLPGERQSIAEHESPGA